MGKFKYLTKVMIKRFFDHNISRVGGQLAFFILLSLFPFLVFLNTLIASLDISPVRLRLLLEPIFPAQVSELVIGYIEQVSEKQSAGLISVAVIVVIYSASKAMRALSYSINAAYGIKGNSRFLRNIFNSMFYVVGAGIIAVVIVLFITLSERVLTEIIKITERTKFYVTILSVCRWVALVAILFFVLAGMYKIMPRKKVEFHKILPGTLLATLGMLFLTYGFSAYVDYFVRDIVFSTTIGAVILLMLWIYFAAIIIILGAELNSVCEKIK